MMSKSSPQSRRPPHRASQRQLRVGEVLRHALVDILARDLVRDPDLAGKSVTVSEVDVSPDLKMATIYCSSLGGLDDEAVIPALNRARAFLRGQLGRRITLRYTPSLAFRLDHTFGEAQAMERLLRSPRVARDLDMPGNSSGARREDAKKNNGGGDGEAR